MTGKIWLAGLLLLLSGVARETAAQGKGVEEMWRYQQDTGRIKLCKPEYLRITGEQLLELFDRQPSFGMYKDNYFITGIPTERAFDTNGE
jgi:hypothetical protein